VAFCIRGCDVHLLRPCIARTFLTPNMMARRASPVVSLVDSKERANLAQNRRSSPAFDAMQTPIARPDPAGSFGPPSSGAVGGAWCVGGLSCQGS
jgi:hypothetical protein